MLTTTTTNHVPEHLFGQERAWCFSGTQKRLSKMAMNATSLAKFFLLFCLLQTAFSAEPVSVQDAAGHDRRLLQDQVFGLIEGGTNARKGRFPYMSSLRKSDDSHACGGALVDKSWVVTAAHCLDPNASDGKPLGLNPQVVIGAVKVTDGLDTEGVEVFLGDAIIHPLWDSDLLNGFDIAMIKLPKPSKIEPVKLAAKGESLSTGKWLSTLGWGADGTGRSFTKDLKWASVVYRSNDQCNSENVWDDKITPEMMCAGGTIADTADVCTGDSGGPLLVPHSPAGKVGDGNPTLDVLTGLTSFGAVPGCNSDEAITDRKPVVYTRISEFRDWIDNVIKGIAAEENKKPKQAAPRAASDTEKPNVECSTGVKNCGRINNNLLIAVITGDDDLFQESLDQGADIEIRDKDENTPLILATLEADLVLVENLLDEGAYGDAENMFGETALFIAAEAGDFEIVDRLLDFGVEVDFGDANETTPLIVASKLGFPDIVELLLNAGADPTLQDEGGNALDQICTDYPDCTKTIKGDIEELLKA